MSCRIDGNVFSQKKMDVAEAAYVAAMIDGEGTISMTPRKGKGRMSHHFAVVVRVANTDLGVMRALVEMAGNGRIVDQCNAARAKMCYRWELSPNQVRHVLPQVIPYLRIKRERAELVLRFQEIQGARGCKESDIPEVLQIFGKIRELNWRGDGPRVEVDFELRPRKHTQLYCSTDGCGLKCYRGHSICYKHWLEQRSPNIHQCERCGKNMDVLMPQKRFCSHECQWKSYRDRREGAGKPRRAYGKLTEEMVREIVDLFKTGEWTPTELGEKFSVDRTNISSILLGKTWQYLNLELPDPALVKDRTGDRHWTKRKKSP
jgi:hypothetical protein